ncbi:MAG TPA: hypothetical protein VJR46_12915 [Candidatus Dormibacteraeota bacterium]|nr:hypothetical protein [Candidatus Dormibacteraeota bacterium]
MTSEQILVLVAAGAAVWAAFFATRADWSSRRAIRQFDAATKPVPKIVFTGNVSPGNAVELEVENLGGTLAASGLIVHVSDELYAGEVSLPAEAPPRRISLRFVVKAWKRQLEPQCLVLIARDVSGRCYDYVDGGRPIKNPRRWLSAQLKELRMQGMVDFPSVTGKEKS